MAIPQYNQNTTGNKFDATIDKKYNYKLYGIPVVAGAGTAHSALAGTDDQAWTHTHDSGLVLYGNYVGANTVDEPPGHANGVEYSMTDTDDIGCQWTVGPFLAGGLEGKSIFTVGSTALPKPAFYFKVHMDLTDVSGTDDCHVGFRLQSDAVETTGVAYTDFASLNIDGGDVKYETNINNGGATSADSGANAGDAGAVDGGFHWYEVRVSKAGLVSFYMDGAQLTTNDPSVTFDAADIVTPWFYFRNHTTLTDCIIDEVEFGLQ